MVCEKDNKKPDFSSRYDYLQIVGAGNIGVFVPTTLNLANLIVTLLTFLVMIYLLVSAQKVAQSPFCWRNF